MEIYKVQKSFTGMLNKKEHVFKSGDIINVDEVHSWKNYEGLISYRFIIKTIMEKDKSSEDKKDDKKSDGVFQ